MNDLFKKQQEPEQKKLLGAQKRLYTEGKRLHSWVLLLTFVSTLLFPILGQKFPDHGMILGNLGGFISLILLILFAKKPQAKRELGAKVQEEFDTRLYGMDWNEELCGKHVSDHEIERADAKLKARENVDERPWYEDYTQLSKERGILACQQENLYWDSRLRRNYSNFLILSGLSLFLMGYCIGFFLLKLTPAQWLPQVFFPLMVYIYQLIEIIQQNADSSTKQAIKIQEATFLVKNAEAEGREISKPELREIQDSIFENRNSSPMVPDWFYKLFDKPFQKLMNRVSVNTNKPKVSPQVKAK